MIIKCTQTLWFQERLFENNMGPLVFFVNFWWSTHGILLRYGVVVKTTQIIPVKPQGLERLVTESLGIANWGCDVPFHG